MSNLALNSDEVRGVYIPIESSQLLLPNAAVTEVVGFQEPTPAAGAPEWLLGELEWRRQTIPIVSFERALGLSEGKLSHRARIIICNTLNGSQDLPFIGVVAKSIPRLIHVRTDNIVDAKGEEDLGPLVLNKVTVAGEEAIIPDLDRLEQMLRDSFGQTASH